MPLDANVAKIVLDYCHRDLQNMQWFLNSFNFVDDESLREQLALEFYTARYMAKLMEALNLTGDELHAHLKFQIIQYASIYEAVIDYLLWHNFRDTEVIRKLETHQSYKEVPAFGDRTKLLYEQKIEMNGQPKWVEEQVFPCILAPEKTPAHSIRFDDKVKAAVTLGLIDSKYADEIKGFYKLRNSIHIAAAAKRKTEFEIDQAKLAFWRMEPFLDQIRRVLRMN